jgi:Sec-independent protein translocase protein TatA
MNILGIGGWEFVAIMLIALVIAGPKRMIRWAYYLGLYMGKLRIMWAETMSVIQREFDEAGVDLKLPKEPPTRHSINRMAQQAFQPFTSEIQKAVDEVEAEAKRVNEALAAPSTNGSATQDQDADKPSQDPGGDFGTWSSAGKTGD